MKASWSLQILFFFFFFTGKAVSDLIEEKRILEIIGGQFGYPSRGVRDPCSWPSVVCTKQGVVKITWDSMGLTGTATSNFCRFKNLAYLSLFNNTISGQLSAFSNCSSLLHLDASNNFFTGSIPASFSRLSNLQSLDLSYNNLTGSIVEELGSIQGLTFLSLSYNKFSGGLPTSLTSHNNLKHLDVTGCSLDTQIPPTLLPSLQEFEISNSLLKGGLPEFTASPNLTFLSLSQNNLTGPIPRPLLNSKSLATFYAWQNQITGGLEEINLRNLIHLDLSENNLTGTIPSTILNSKRLQHLAVFSNALSGELPVEMGVLPSLTVLKLFDNSLEGGLPSNLGAFSRLEVVDVAYNYLSGDIPEDLCSKGGLRELYLLGNEFRGGIPDALGRCAALQSLDLSYNRLTGEIPKSLGNLSDMTVFNVSYNDLKGSIPLRLQQDEFKTSFFGNPDLCSEDGWGGYPKCV